jgi:enoyl-CoA hydratase/carnithine racemase
MLFTGMPISAQEAERIGLVNKVVPVERLRETTLQLARQIMQTSAETLAIGKRAFYAQLPLDWPEAYTMAQKVMVDNAQTPNAQEGIQAFLDKRSPKWTE